MSKPILFYFDFPGRAEGIRLALKAGNIDFEDRRLKYDDFVKSVKSTSPTGKLPMLEYEGRKYVESSALLDFACELSGNIPTTPKERLVSRMLVDKMQEFWVPLLPVVHGQTGKAVDHAKEELTKFFKQVDSLVEHHQEAPGKLFKGKKFSPAEIMIFFWVHAFKHQDFKVPLGDMQALCPHLYKVFETVWAENKPIQDWYKGEL
eukprot:Gregarina_sp_Pseudo_9__2688@NODE_2933_length_813_cov_14_359173_g2679_i0_p1_GENE_NODE_2933_length_813_cov_14_359173_g2679_i0NODE_2933_length_813_cov_14_359173_g2679_i0_p1_ORF_typecomplete_len205_score53_87GST_N/PF02798_20/1_2e08GST_C_5/PF16865_5/3_3e06GST_N_3/PF13417_6/3_9e05GST_C_3/PF14497_6/2_8e05GST_C/PF00043_25/7_6e05GST_N_4/PF17172_4/0_00017GST_C_2/PF13410_6/0_0056baeRF_family7/PF18849_1/0_27_NODE_2933_length_813_cov_14_359173_g2679_i062676